MLSCTGKCHCFTAPLLSLSRSLARAHSMHRSAAAARGLHLVPSGPRPTPDHLNFTGQLSDYRLVKAYVMLPLNVFGLSSVFAPLSWLTVRYIHLKKI